MCSSGDESAESNPACAHRDEMSHCMCKPGDESGLLNGGGGLDPHVGQHPELRCSLVLLGHR